MANSVIGFKPMWGPGSRSQPLSAVRFDHLGLRNFDWGPGLYI